MNDTGNVSFYVIGGTVSGVGGPGAAVELTGALPKLPRNSNECL
jgi:hypothetical protein